MLEWVEDAFGIGISDRAHSGGTPRFWVSGGSPRIHPWQRGFKPRERLPSPLYFGGLFWISRRKLKRPSPWVAMYKKTKQ